MMHVKWASTERRRAAKRRYARSPKGRRARRSWDRRYARSTKGRNSQRRYEQSVKGRMKDRRYQSSEKGRRWLRAYFRKYIRRPLRYLGMIERAPCCGRRGKVALGWYENRKTGTRSRAKWIVTHTLRSTSTMHAIRFGEWAGRDIRFVDRKRRELLVLFKHGLGETMTHLKMNGAGGSAWRRAAGAYLSSLPETRRR